MKLSPDCTLVTIIMAFWAPLAIAPLRSSWTKFDKSISFSAVPAIPRPYSSAPSLRPYSAVAVPEFL